MRVFEIDANGVSPVRRPLAAARVGSLGALEDAVSRLDPPEGFHVFYLPFRDDRRRPESAVASRARPITARE